MISLVSGVLSSEKKKKVKGKVVLIEREDFSVKEVGDSSANRAEDFLGQKVGLRLVSATVGDPKNGNRGVLGPEACLEKGLQPIVPASAAGEKTYGVTFTVVDGNGIPGAVIVKNRNLAEFYLKFITIEKFPGKGRIHFDCNSWVYNCDKYAHDRVFFSNDPYLPKQTPDPLRPYREDELRNLRGDDVSRRLEKWDRVYNYASYNDLGNPDAGRSLSRPVIGGSAALPYPRRGRTGRPPTKTDPHTESAPALPDSEIYVPSDELSGHGNPPDFLGATMKTVAKDLLPMLKDALTLSPDDFDSFNEVLSLYERGLPLPDVPLVRRFLEAAPCEKFRARPMPDSDQSRAAPPPEKFKDLVPVLRAILNLDPHDFGTFKEVMCLHKGGLPLPDIPLVRKLLEAAPSERSKGATLPKAEDGPSSGSPEGAPFAKLKNLVPMLKVLLNFTPNQFDSFKNMLELHRKGSPLPNDPLVRMLLEAAPYDVFRDAVARPADEDSLFKLPEDAPSKKHFKDLLPMLLAVLNFTPNERDLFKEVLNHYEGGAPLPDIPLMQKFLAAAPSEKFTPMQLPGIDQDKLFQFSTTMLLGKFKDLMPVFRVIQSLAPNEFDALKDALDQFEHGSPLQNHPLTRKILEAAPSDKFKGTLNNAVGHENLFSAPEDGPSEEEFKDMLPMLQTAMNLTSGELGPFKEVLGHHDESSPLQDIPVVQKFLKVPSEDSKVVLAPTGYHESLLRSPEAAPLEKSFNELQPVLNVIMDLKPRELDQFKEVLGRYENGLPLPDIPVVQQFLDIAPCEQFDSVLVPSIDPETFSEDPEGAPSKKFKDIFPMLHQVMNFTPTELNSLKEGIDLYKSGSPLKNSPVIQKVLDAAPSKKTKGTPKPSDEHDNPFSLPESAPLEKHFNDLLPMLQTILNMTKTDFSSFKEVVDKHKDGIPLPDIPVVQNVLQVAPCEKFKTLLMPIKDHESLFSLPEAAPLENYFKDHLPMLQFILNLAPNEWDRFKQVLSNYKGGFSLPDVPLIRNFLEAAPSEKFKGILTPSKDHEKDSLKLPEAVPVEKFKDLVPMLQILVNSTFDELNSFKEALHVCEGGNPPPDIPLIRKFLEAAPYEKFKSIITAADPGCLFKLPEAAPLDKYFKALLPLLKPIANFNPNELQSFKQVLDKHGHGLPLPGIPLVKELLEVAPCEKFRVVLMQNSEKGSPIAPPENTALEKFKDLIPMLRVITNFSPKECDSFKSFLDHCEDGSPFPDIPVVRKFLEVTPFANLHDNKDTGDKGSLPKLPEGIQKGYFKPLLPGLKMIMSLKPDEFESFKGGLKNCEDGSPLPDVPAIHKFLDVAPSEFEPVLVPTVGHDSLFGLPESAPMEKHFKDLLPMFQSIINFTPTELDSFRNILGHYEYGLPLPDISVVRKFLEAAPDEKFKGVLTPSAPQGNLPKFHEDMPLQNLKDLIPVLRGVMSFKPDEFNTFKKIMDQYESGFPLPDTPLVRKFFEATPFENLKEILAHSSDKGSLFELPEAAPLHRYFKGLLPILQVVFNLMPNELESLKEVLDHHDCGLALPQLPLVQKFLQVAPCEKFKAVLMPDNDDNISKSQAIKPFKTFKDIFPTLQVITNFTRDETKSFKDVLDHCKKGSPLPDIPLVRKLLEAAPGENFKPLLTHNADKGSFFSLPQAAPLDKYFKKLAPMFQTIVDFTDDEFDSFKEALDQFNNGFPLPNTPLVKKFLEAAPCEKFKAIFTPKVDQDSLFRFDGDAPLEKYFKDLLPQFKAIFDMAPKEFETFQKVLGHFDAGLPLPNIPSVQKFLESAPDEKFKTLFTPGKDPSSPSQLPEVKPLENFKDLLPMLLVLVKFPPHEFKAFKEVLDPCKKGLPLPDTPQVRKFLEAAPFEKFKSVLNQKVDQGNLFKLPEAAPLEKFFKDLLPMLEEIVNFTPIEFDPFKEALENFKTGLPFPNTPIISKFLENAPCNKFKAVLTPTVEKGPSLEAPKDGPSKKFKDLLPMMNVVTNFTPNQFNSFKDILHRCKAGLPLQDIPLVRKVLEVAPCEKFKDILNTNTGQKSLFSLPEAKPLENYFKNLLPMLQTVADLTPNDLNSFKEALGQFEGGLPLSDSPLVRKVLEVAPCEKFESVLTPTTGQEDLFSLPESLHLERHLKDTLPMFQAVMNFTTDELNSFKELLHYHECGLPLPDIPLVRRLLEAAPDNKFKDMLASDRNRDENGVIEEREIPMDQTGASDNVLKFKDLFTPDVDNISFFKLPEVAFFEKFVTDVHGISPCSLLKLPVPKIIQEDKWAWATDEEFAREMLAGINPIVIKHLTVFPPRSELDHREFGNQNSTITAEIIQPNLDGHSVKQALDSNRLFILDHHDAVMPHLRRINAGEHKVYATRTVLFLKKDDTLKPVAIELSLPKPNGFGAVSEVFTPASFGVQGALWLLAKAYVIVNDSGVHQLTSHWLRTHAVLEPFVIAMNRQLSVMHPIHKLLAPHFRETMSINAIYRHTLLNAGGLFELTSFPGKYAMEMSAAAYKSWNFVEQGLPADLIKRGIAVEDKSSPHNLRLRIQDYPYAVDGLEIWSAIESWVREYCCIYYPDDHTLQEDDELQSWWKEIREVGHGDLKDRPWWPKMSRVPELVQSCATIIWIASAMHAAVNFGQYDYAAYMPNRPTISRRFIPSAGSPEYEQLKRNPEKAFLETIGSRLQTLVGIAVMEVQSTHASDEVYLGRRASAEWTSDAHAVNGLNRFCSKLNEAEKKIVLLNQNPVHKNRTGPAKMAYTLLSPYSEGGITRKGIPNSVSI